MIQEKTKKTNLKDFEKRVIEYLSNKKNIRCSIYDVMHNSIDNYYSLDRIQKETFKKHLFKFAKKNKENIFLYISTQKEDRDYTVDELLGLGDYNIKLYFYQKQYDITMNGSTIEFNHLDRGKATYNLNYSHSKVNNKAVISLTTYFKYYTLGRVGGKPSTFFDDRKNMVNDLIHSDNEFIRYVGRYIIPNLKDLIKHEYKNLGKVLPFFLKFENKYNWKSLGISVDSLPTHKPCDLPKNVLKIISEKNLYLGDEFFYYLRNDPDYINKLILTLDNERIPLFIERNRNEDNAWETLIESEPLNRMVSEHNCELKAILRYMFNYILPYERMGLEKALTTLRDYISMHKQMGIESFKKYPKYLQSMHDIIQGEFKLFNKNFDELKFKEKVREELEFKKMMFDKKEEKEKVKFVVRVPRCTEDVKLEGKCLNHCVGSYIDRIIKGQTQILFLRKDEEIPLVTLEVRDNVLIQARGDSNRSITGEERKMITEYAKEKELLVRI